MRLVVECELQRETAFPVNHQHLLTGLVYGLLACSDGEFARFLHDEGYAADTGPKRFKLFCFSGLRAGRRRVAGQTLWLGPGKAEWLLSSPQERFLTHFATGLLTSGEMQVGAVTLP